jgi:hypothetical protein
LKLKLDIITLSLKNVMKIIIQIVANIITKGFHNTETIKPLGRWSIETCSTKINNKIDLSNEDHCGPCGQYAIDKTKITDSVIAEDFKIKP